MRGIVVASLVVATLAGVGEQQWRAAAAAPPVRTATPTPSVVPTVTPTATATPATSMWISADVIVNAAPSFERVTALIGDVECASGTPIIPVDTQRASVDLVVPSAAERPGCGTPGAVVHFRIGGKEARETVAWQPGGYTHVSLIVGPAWATYQGNFSWPWTPGSILFEAVAVIDGRECGRQFNPLQGEGPEWGYGIRVLPEELVPGCGRAGSVVHFELRAGDVLLARARETAVWRPGELQELNLTFAAVSTLPATGRRAGAAQPGGAGIALALGSVGMACVVAGARVRRRSDGEPPVRRRAGRLPGR